METTYLETSRTIGEYDSIRITWNDQNPKAVTMLPMSMDADAMRIVAKELLAFASEMDRRAQK